MARSKTWQRSIKSPVIFSRTATDVFYANPMITFEPGSTLARIRGQVQFTWADHDDSPLGQTNTFPSASDVGSQRTFWGIRVGPGFIDQSYGPITDRSSQDWLYWRANVWQLQWNIGQIWQNGVPASPESYWNGAIKIDPISWEEISTQGERKYDPSFATTVWFVWESNSTDQLKGKSVSWNLSTLFYDPA